MKALRRIPGLLLASSVALALAAPAATAQAQTEPARLSDVTVSSQPDAVTVFVKTSREPRYNAELIDGPVRLVVDLADTVYSWRKTPLPLGVGPLMQIRGSQWRKGFSRVVFDMTRKTGYAIREEADGLAIVIPTARRAEAPPVSAAAADPTPPARAPAAGRAPEPAAPVQVAQATPQAAPPGGPRMISFDFKDADVVNLLRILAAESGRNIVIGDDVKGKMSISLRNVPWELALDTVLETRGLKKLEKDGVLRIVSTEQLLKEREAAARVEEARIKATNELRAKAAEAALKEQEAIDKKRASEAALAELRARGPLREETIRLSYADPEELAKTLQGILGIPPEGVQAQIAPPMYSPATGPPNPELPPLPSLLTSTPPPPPAAPAAAPSAEVLAKGITIRAHRPTNSIFIRHYEADLARIKKLIREKFDIPLPQVKIEARMEILDRTDLFAIGVRWGGGGIAVMDKATLVGTGFTSATTGMAPVGLGTLANPNLTLTSALPVTAATGLSTGGNLVNLPIGSLLGGAATSGVGGFSFGIIGSRMNVNLALEALKSEGKTRTLARPEVITVENNKATISLGEEIPYATVSSAGTQIQFKEALLKLDVTPTVIHEANNVNKIKMKVLVENNSRSNTTVDLGTSAGSPPVINRRKAETEVLIREGERLVIGGVTNNADDEETRKVPVFGDIPFLGWLFKQKATRFVGRELVIFLTPTILNNELAKQGSPPAAPKK